MRMTILCLAAAAIAAAQDPSKPVLRAGVSVQMVTAPHAVEMRAADELDATVVAITSTGKVYNGTTVVEPQSLGTLPAPTIYVKADARAPVQMLVSVLDALRGKTVVLLAAPPPSVPKAGILPPYGITLTVPR